MRNTLVFVLLFFVVLPVFARGWSLKIKDLKTSEVKAYEISNEKYILDLPSKYKWKCSLEKEEKIETPNPKIIALSRTLVCYSEKTSLGFSSTFLCEDIPQRHMSSIENQIIPLDCVQYYSVGTKLGSPGDYALTIVFDRTK